MTTAYVNRHWGRSRASASAALFCMAALLSFGLAAGVSAQIAGHAEYCEIALTGCPQDYDAAELVVPLNVVALSTKIQACGIADSAVTPGSGSGAAPAVMFVIDHSLSMTSGEINDTLGNRFRVTQALIDTIYSVYPDAEVGIAIFADALVFDANRDSNLVRFQGDTSTVRGGNAQLVPRQSYMPLLPLNQAAKTGGSNPFYSGSGPAPLVIDVYRSMFTVPASQNRQATITGGPRERSGTDISLGFEAALEAFANSNKPKENQYIIFLSDGTPSVICGGNASNPRCGKVNDYIAGVNTPATYTVYLSRGAAANTPPPASIAQMTGNIKANGYSATNASSDVWVLQSNYSDLLALMMENIITPMLSKTSGDAKKIVISSAGVSDSSGVMDGDFRFSRRLPLDTAEVTAVSMNISYDVRVDTLVNINGKDTLVYARTAKDSLFSYSFTVRRSASPGADWRFGQNIDSECGAMPTLDLQFQGQSLIGKEAKGNMDRLTIVLDNTGGLFDYNKVIVQVLNADGTLSDLEEFTLTKSGSVWTYSFPREVSSTANAGDKKLQHNGLDSIILVFRNPDIPLDTIRVSVPFISNTMLFYDGPGDPARPGVDKLPDTITVRAGDTTDIYVKLFNDKDGKWDSLMTADPGKITWTVSDPRVVTLTGGGEHGQIYAETAGGTYTVTATYTDGSLVIVKQITVKVATGDPFYLEVVFDAGDINKKRASVDSLAMVKGYTFEKDVDSVTFYAVERDRFGNYIGHADNSVWASTDPVAITADVSSNGNSALVRRHGSKFDDSLYVAVSKGGLTVRVKISVVIESAVSVGPNPFVPGKSNVMDRLNSLGPETARIYGPIVQNSKGGESATGVLIAATAPRS
ncbi:MAG: hypothetical protein LBH93_08355, partial [Chitinispirillales bacterium]|nr:hypothetical protein [Chitinispirillales bacterium]